MHHKLNQRLLLAKILLVLVPFILGLSLPSIATNEAIYAPPGQTLGQGAPPPPGAGQNSPLVVGGDSNKRDVVTGTPVSSPEHGTNLPIQSEMRRGKVNLLMSEPGRGTRVVLTFQPDELTQQQRGTVEGILGVGPFNADEPYQNITVDKQKLADMQDALSPYPASGVSSVSMKNGTQRSWISSDAPASGYPKYGSNGIHPMLNGVQPFCRYLVLMGVVVACIFLVFAGVGIMFGNRNAGSAAIGAVAGLMLLLMSYSIWKLVRFNAINARGPLVVDFNNLPGPQPSRGYSGDNVEQKGQPNLVSPRNANLPVVPSYAANTDRSGLPLKPLGSIH